jgi:hypothetical protein
MHHSSNFPHDPGPIISEMTDYPDAVSEAYALELEITPNVYPGGGSIEPGMETLGFEAPQLCHMVETREFF